MRNIKLLIFLFVFIIILVLMEIQNHYLPCSKLPPEAFVKEFLSSHKDPFDAILDVDPGHFGVEVDATTCPGKADLIIWYPSHQDRIAIQEILKDASFYGVPLRLQNR